MKLRNNEWTKYSGFNQYCLVSNFMIVLFLCVWLLRSDDCCGIILYFTLYDFKRAFGEVLL